MAHMVVYVVLGSTALIGTRDVYIRSHPNKNYMRSPEVSFSMDVMIRIGTKKSDGFMIRLAAIRWAEDRRDICLSLGTASSYIFCTSVLEGALSELVF